jgi:hypothetical protein
MKRKGLNISDDSVRGRQTAIKSFADFLATNAVSMPAAQELLNSLAAWQVVTAGMVEGYKWWLIENHYRANTVNNRLGYIKRMAKAAFDAGHLSAKHKVEIEDIEDVSPQQGHNIEKRRHSLGVGGISTRKTEYNPISAEQCFALKTNHPDTPQGRRDRVMMCLFLADGLKIVDATQLTIGDLKTRILSEETLCAIAACINAGDIPDNSQKEVLWAIGKGGKPTHAGITSTACALRVKELGWAVGIERLTPSDCKNYFDNNALTPEMENRKLRKDNQKLAAENERLRFEIAALNSALRSKNYASPRMAGAMDWSSVDLGN